jgi:hypothetical protein
VGREELAPAGWRQAAAGGGDGVDEVAHEGHPNTPAPARL